MLQGPSSSARTRALSSPSGRSLDLSKNPWLSGSGQPGMPCERMQRAKANAEATVPVCVVVAPACVVPAAVAVEDTVEEATFATPGEPPPPHPAASSEHAATATTETSMSGGRHRTISVPFSREQDKLTTGT